MLTAVNTDHNTGCIADNTGCTADNTGCVADKIGCTGDYTGCIGNNIGCTVDNTVAAGIMGSGHKRGGAGTLIHNRKMVKS